MKNHRKIVLAGILTLGLLGAKPYAGTRLLAIMPNAEPFHQALEGLQSDLGNNYEVRWFNADLPKASDSLQRVISNFQPQGLVLMDTKAIGLAKEAQKESVQYQLLPKFVLMTLRAEDAIRDLKNSAGIKFEVPAYTIFTNLHIISKRDFHRVGVFYRESFTGFFQESKKFLAKEKIDLVGECLNCGLNEKAAPVAVYEGLRAGMVKMASQKVDVIWMLADNALVNDGTLKGFWLAQFKSYGVPLVVPLPNLASLDLNLGMFGVWPDYRQLGMQAAQQVIQVFESGEAAGSLGLETLVGVQMVLNLEMAKRAKWDINGEKLNRMSIILKRN